MMRGNASGVATVACGGESVVRNSWSDGENSGSWIVVGMCVSVVSAACVRTVWEEEQGVYRLSGPAPQTQSTAQTR